MKTVELYGRQIEVVVDSGRAILVDGWDGHCPSILEDCELPEFAPFRLPSGRYTDVAYACKVEVTGRVLQSRPYDDRLWVRVRVEWVKDGEPNTFSRGWMAV